MAGSNSTNQVPTSSSNQQSSTPGSSYSPQGMPAPIYGTSAQPSAQPTTPSYQYGGDTTRPTSGVSAPGMTMDASTAPSSGVSYTGPELTMDGGPTPQITLPANPFSQGPGMTMDNTPQNPFSQGTPAPPAAPGSNPFSSTAFTSAAPQATGDFTNASNVPGVYTNKIGYTNQAGADYNAQAVQRMLLARTYGYTAPSDMNAVQQVQAGLLTPYDKYTTQYNGVTP